MRIKTIDDVKEMIRSQLIDMHFIKVEDGILDNPKFKDVYQLISDDIEIFVILTKDGDQNCIEFHGFVDQDDETKAGLRTYDSYVDILMQQKKDKEFIKSYLVTIINTIEQSLHQ